MHSAGRSHEIVALDVGAARIGVARASSLVRLAEPLLTLPNDANLWERLADLCVEHNVQQLVVGLPRGLDGQETDQTVAVREFVAQLDERLKLPIALQDEAVTSRQAEAELSARGKPYAKGEVDALAATYILEDYLNTSRGTL